MIMLQYWPADVPAAENHLPSFSCVIIGIAALFKLLQSQENTFFTFRTIHNILC